MISKLSLEHSYNALLFISYDFKKLSYIEMKSIEKNVAVQRILRIIKIYSIHFILYYLSFFVYYFIETFS